MKVGYWTAAHPPSGKGVQPTPPYPSTSNQGPIRHEGAEEVTGGHPFHGHALSTIRGPAAAVHHGLRHHPHVRVLPLSVHQYAPAHSSMPPNLAPKIEVDRTGTRQGPAADSGTPPTPGAPRCPPTHEIDDSAPNSKQFKPAVLVFRKTLAEGRGQIVIPYSSISMETGSPLSNTTLRLLKTVSNTLILL